LTLSDLLKVIDRKQIDILHLHGYGGDDVWAAWRGGARHSSDPARTRQSHRHALVPEVPTACSEPYTDIAIAVSKSTADS